MAIVGLDGEWYVVEVDGQALGWFGAMLDANRFALGMLHDGMVGQVSLFSGLRVV
tara:strand:- start:339 stop:503 length:165 start_codon:yes stop_codon:yes gene_type:complete